MLFFTWNSEKFTAITCFFKNYPYLCVPLHKKTGVGEIKFDIGEMAEWSNAAVLKTVDLNGSGGSNPSLSANKLKLSALRWAFFVQVRREPRSCKDLHGKSPKGRLAFELQFV